ncbi:MAG: hypothetical protein ACXWCC_15570 [Caldimonas sp.]
MTTSLSLWKSCAVAALVALSGCGGGTDTVSTPPPAATYSIGGTVFSSGGTIVLQNNGGDDLTLGNVGTFTFPTKLASGATYSVTVKSSPGMPLQTCVTGANAGGPATGTVAGADVTGLFVFCSPVPLTLGGNVSGLVGSGLALASDLQGLAIAANGNFQFAAPILSTGSYTVSVATQPSAPAQTCVVTNGSGNQPTANVTNVQVTCSAPGFACGSENGTVVTHSSNIAASETWAGNGTVHLVANPISIAAPATVTIQSCAIVKLALGAGIDVRGASSGTGTARLFAAGTDPATGFVTFENSDKSAAPGWGRLRALNANSLIDLENVVISGGGNVGGSQRNAVISMNGSGVLPDATLRAINVTISAPAGVGIYLSDAAFTSDSQNLTINDQTDAMLAMPAMALGSVPANTLSLRRTVNEQILVVENANIFDNLTIATPIPIHFKTDGVHVGGLAPTFVQNVTLTLQAGVVLMFERASTSPTLVTFGDVGQPTDKNAALVVQGTALNPVVFTSALALPLVPGGTAPAPGDWAGLWLVTSNGSQIDHAVIEYAGGDAAIGPLNCGPIDPTIRQQARHTAPLLVGDGTDRQYVPPAGLITNSVFRNNTGNFAIDSVWESTAFGPSLNATNSFGGGAKFCTQSKNLIVGGCVVAGVDQSGCLVP